MKSQRKILLMCILMMLLSNIFLSITTQQSVRAQSDSLFSDDFDTNQPNSQFTLGSNDVINSIVYVSPTNSLQVSSESVTPFSHATFDNMTGQIYVKMFYETNNTGYSNILQLKGETAYIGIYQDQNGIIFDWDYGFNETYVLLSPNVWYNITLSLYLDPNNGSSSSAMLWLNGSIIANQQMPQVDGYYIDTLVFDTIQVWRTTTRYDDIVVSTHSNNVPSPTPVPTETSSPTAVPTATPTSTPISTATPTSSPSTSHTPTVTPTNTPTSTPTSTATPTVPEMPFILAFFAFLAITGLLLVKFRKHFACRYPPYSSLS